jgi:hypothetical protein
VEAARGLRVSRDWGQEAARTQKTHLHMDTQKPVCVTVLAFHYCNKCLRQSTYKEERFILAHSFGSADL